MLSIILLSDNAEWIMSFIVILLTPCFIRLEKTIKGFKLFFIKILSGCIY